MSNNSLVSKYDLEYECKVSHFFRIFIKIAFFLRQAPGSSRLLIEVTLPNLRGEAAAELCTGDGSGNGHVEALGSVVCAVTGNEKAMVHSGAYFRRDAIAFVAHDDKPVRGEGLGVDVLSVEQGAIDGEAFWQGVDELYQISINNVHARNAAHRGLYHLRIPGIDSVFTADDVVYAKPVGYADDGAQVAWVLDAVEGKEEGFFRGRRKEEGGRRYV
jgi:hypothetical protein